MGNPIGFRDEAFRVPPTPAEDRLAAIAAVRAALEAFDRQTWYQTAWARFRFAAYWLGYRCRLALGRFLVSKMGWDGVRTAMRLGL